MIVLHASILAVHAPFGCDEIGNLCCNAISGGQVPGGDGYASNPGQAKPAWNPQRSFSDGFHEVRTFFPFAVAVPKDRSISQTSVVGRRRRSIPLRKYVIDIFPTLGFGILIPTSRGCDIAVPGVVWTSPSALWGRFAVVLSSRIDYCIVC